MRVDDEESLFLFLSSYLDETFEKHEKDLIQVYREKYRGENYLYAFVLNERLQLWKNGEKIMKFHLEDWKKELEELEIIL